MSFEIVIVTRFRSQLLHRCLKSIENALEGFDHVRVFCVLNGPDSESERILSETYRFQLIQISEGVEVFPGAARNVVRPWLSSDWVWFLDDDIEVPHNFFRDFEAIKAELPEAQVFGGPNLTPEGSQFFQKLGGELLGNPWLCGPSVARYRTGSVGFWATEAHLTLCNLAVQRELFQNEGFAKDLVCAEENEWWGRSSYPSWWDPRLAVTHERRPNLSSFVRQFKKYGWGRGQIVWAGHWRWFHLVFALSAFIVISLLFLAPKLFLAALLSYFFVTILSAVYFGSSLRTRSLIPFLIPVLHLAYFWGLFSGALSAFFLKFLGQRWAPKSLR